MYAELWQAVLLDAKAIAEGALIPEPVPTTEYWVGSEPYIDKQEQIADLPSVRVDGNHEKTQTNLRCGDGGVF